MYDWDLKPGFTYIPSSSELLVECSKGGNCGWKNLKYQQSKKISALPYNEIKWI